MSGKGSKKGVILATAAALLITSQAFAIEQTTSTTKPVKCYGVNSCRAKGQCGGKTSNACAGQNACKGKGWIFMSPAECQAKKGTVLQ